MFKFKLDDPYKTNSDQHFFIEPTREVVEIVRLSQSPGMKVAEIGTYDGSTIRGYIDIVKQNSGRVYCIDTFEGNVLPQDFLDANPLHYANNPHVYGDHNKGLYLKFLTNFKDKLDMMTILRGKSEDLIQFLPNDLDVCFIDADHSYQGAKKDIELCLSKVKHGGILCGHDCESFEYVNTFTEKELAVDTVMREGKMYHAGVIQAVYDTLGPVQIAGIVWYVRIMRN